MTTVAQIKKKVEKHEHALKVARKELAAAKRKARQAKESQTPTLAACLATYNRELRDARRYNNVNTHALLKESRSYYKEICEHLLEGGTVRITCGQQYAEYDGIVMREYYHNVLRPKFRFKAGRVEYPDTWQGRRTARHMEWGEGVLRCLMQNRAWPWYNKDWDDQAGLVIEFL